MKIFIQLIVFILIHTSLMAQTVVSGTISSDSIWSADKSPYLVTGDVTVQDGVTLTVNPSVSVKLNPGVDIYVYGTLNATNAFFTSYRDTVGGSPSMGDWRNIQVGSNTISGSANFNNCTISYGYTSIYLRNGNLVLNSTNVHSSNSANINIHRGSAEITGCSIFYNDPTNGRTNLYAQNDTSTIIIENSNFYNAEDNIYLSNQGNVEITGSSLYHTSSTVLSSYRNIYIDEGNLTLTSVNISQAQENIYTNGGDILLNNVEISNTTAGGYGITALNNSEIIFEENVVIESQEYPIIYRGPANFVFPGAYSFSNNIYDVAYLYLTGSHNTSYSMFLDTLASPYLLGRDFIIQANSKLEIAPSNVIKFNDYTGFFVDGTFVAEGKQGEEISFTSVKDDNIGGDTNNDGNGSVPSLNNWQGINFRAPSNDAECVLKWSILKFAGYYNSGSVNIYDSSPTIDNNQISNSYFGIKIEGESDPVISNNTIGITDMVPVAMSIHSNPNFLNNSFSTQDNEYDAIGILTGTMTRNAVLIKRSFSSVQNVTYMLLGSITIPQNITLTIEKGIVIKGYYYHHRILVEGKLVADGTVDDKIVFTSYRDDNFGNPEDTNKDGTQTNPTAGNWGGIIFKQGSSSESILDYCVIQYGQYYDYKYPYYGQVNIINCNPTISNCQISNVDIGIISGSSAQPVIENNIISNTNSAPIAISVTSQPTFSGNTYSNNNFTALGIIGEEINLDADINRRVIAGYDNITYILLGQLKIGSNSKLDIEAGVVIKGRDGNAALKIEGALRAVGDVQNGDIVFTSHKDDNRGNPNDTNGDGVSSNPSHSDWGGILFAPTSDDQYSLLDNCQIYYAGYWLDNVRGGLNYIDASPACKNTVVSDCYYGITVDGSSDPQFDNIVIQNCNQDPISLSLISNPTLNNISFIANGTSGIKILEETLSSNARLLKRSVAGITNVAYIVRNLTISSSAVLTIDPGVVVKFPEYYNNNIVVNGALIANGLPTEKIVFTSLSDDSRGGDTNNDANQTTPSKGNWDAIIFQNTSVDSLNSIKHAEIRYGGNRGNGNVAIYDCKVKIDSAYISQSYSSAIGVFGSANPVISNSEITNARLYPVYMSLFSNPVFSNNSAYNVGIMALGVKPETYSVNSVVPKRNFAGYENITYYFNGESTINSGTTIKIPAGLKFKNAKFTVNGSVQVNGTETEKVVFTELRDDMYGTPLDTEDNGDATKPSIGYYYNYIFKMNDVSTDSLSHFKNVIFRYANYGIILNSASPSISNCEFNVNDWGTFLDGNSFPSLDSCNFINNRYGPILTSIISYPSSSVDNHISGSTYRCIGIKGETLVQDYILRKRNFGGIENIPYYFIDDYKVATGVTLTIESGIVLKFNRWVDFTVSHGLLAQGGNSLDSTIVFTSIADDFYGGDTNADSNATSPAVDDYYNEWQGIKFTNESLDPQCVLANTVVRFANIGITATSANPTITNSAITQNVKGILINGASNPLINFCDIYKNKTIGVENESGAFTVNAENNWWGNNSGPMHASNPSGTGQNISDYVSYQPFLGNGSANPLAGDVSLNGSIQSYDASLILRYVVNPNGVDSLNELQRSVADVSGNGAIQAMDASYILRYVVGDTTTFPSELNKSGFDETKRKSLRQLFALQKSASAEITIPEGFGKFGEEIKIPVRLSNVKNLIAAEIQLEYNPALFENVNVEAGSLLEGTYLSYFVDDEKGMISIAVAGSEYRSDISGDLLYINASIPEKLKGNYSTQFSIKKFIANEKDNGLNAQSGNIAIEGLPDKYSLLQNYPNPFNPSTIIEYKIPDDNSNVKLAVYNQLGQLVKIIADGSHTAGSYKAVWNGTNEYGSKVSSGIYIYRLISNNKTIATKKLLLMK